MTPTLQLAPQASDWNVNNPPCLEGRCDRCRRVGMLAYYAEGLSLYRETRGHDGVWLCLRCDARTNRDSWADTHQAALRVWAYYPIADAEALAEARRLFKEAARGDADTPVIAEENP